MTVAVRFSSITDEKLRALKAAAMKFIRFLIKKNIFKGMFSDIRERFERFIEIHVLPRESCLI